MSTLPGRPALRLLILLLISTLLFSCGSSENPLQAYDGTGIAFQLKWPVAKSVGSVPAGVVTVRMSVSGPGMSTISKDFAASAGSGSISDVPVGSGRTITFQGLNAAGTPTYEGVVSNVELKSGITYNCGTVAMGNTVPTAPASLSAAPASASQINLAWADNATNETGYRIERKTGAGGAYAPIATLAANVSSYSDASLASATTYFYRVTAVNGLGDSAYSNEASAVTPEITYSISGTVTSGGTALAGVALTLSGSGSSSATTGSGGSYSFSGARNGSYTLEPLLAGYVFSPPTQAVTINGADLPAVNFSASASTVPAAPSGLSAAPVSASRINLAWADNANNEAGYLVERKTGAGGTYAQIATLAANVTTYSDFSLAAVTDYYYRVRAANSMGNSAYSNEANAVTFDTATLITPDLVKVVGGTYAMGGTALVTVGDFSIGRYEVTQGEWRAVMVSNPSTFAACGLDCPVESVSWNDVQTFISELNRLSGKNYRLPTEAEWEYAARSGGLDQKYSGGSDVDAVAWYAGNSLGLTHRVGLKLPNGLGNYDMSGNVSEWLGDSCSGSNRVIRGGSSVGAAALQETTALRGCFSPSFKKEYLGFRLVITTP